MLRPCTDQDVPAILAVVNDGATAYAGHVPADCLGEPYVGEAELRAAIAAGVAFHGFEADGALVGVMGIQPVADVVLIRHAYVRTARRGQGVGGALLAHLRGLTDRPILIGTWKAATWAIGFYERHGFRLAPPEEKDRLLAAYWSIPKRQADLSVALLDDRALAAGLVPIYELATVDGEGRETVVRRGPGPFVEFARAASTGARAGVTHHVYREFKGRRGLFEAHTAEDYA